MTRQDQVPSYRDVVRTLEDVLADPDFRAIEPSLLDRGLREILSTMGRWIRDLLSAIPAGSGGVLAWTLIAAGVLVVVFALSKWGSHALATARKAGRTGPLGSERPATASDCYRRAAERAARGDFRAAATALYRGVLLVLDGTGAIALHASKTPGDYMAELSRRPRAASPELDPARFLQAFQHFSFSEIPPTASGYRELEAAAEHCRESRSSSQGSEPRPRDTQR